LEYLLQVEIILVTLTLSRYYLFSSYPLPLTEVHQQAQ